MCDYRDWRERERGCRNTRMVGGMQKGRSSKAVQTSTLASLALASSMSASSF